MSDLGIEIHLCYDELGPVRVFENGSKRYLAFGEDAEQSCIDMHHPEALVYTYTQAMLLALIFMPKPKQAMLLGLGAGSLVHALHHYDHQLKLNVVELRAVVIEVAKQWFGLALFPELSLNIGDAAEYIAKEQPLNDLIFTDIYNDQGMIESQLDAKYLENCYQNLSDDGILVLNLWDEGGSHPRAIQAIRDQFGDQHCMTCLIEEGNLIAYAFKSGVPQVNPRRLQPVAKRLAKQTGIPASKLLECLKIV